VIILNVVTSLNILIVIVLRIIFGRRFITLFGYRKKTMIIYKTVDKLKVNLYDDLTDAVMKVYSLELLYDVCDKVDVYGDNYTALSLSEILKGNVSQYEYGD